MRRSCLVLATIVPLSLTLSGCVGVAKFPTIEPVSYRPSGMNTAGAVAVHTLQPTFSWKPLPGADAYDLAIWSVGPDDTPGESAYNVEDVKGCEHAVTKILYPGEYYWSVRKHGTTVWATASFTQANPLFVSWGKGLPFKIKIMAK